MFSAWNTGRRPGRRATLAAVLFAVSGAALFTAAAQQSGPPAPPSASAGAIAWPPYPGSALAGDTVLHSREGDAGGSSESGAQRRAMSAGAAVRPAAEVGLPRSRPVRLVIPRIGVRTSVVGLGLNADGTVETPPLRPDAPAGWYRYLASPGEVGPAVILGHVDSAWDGPAVFYRLGELRPGDRIDVTRADGIVARFVVTRVVLVPKSDFPTAAVYGPTADPQLRLLTCGGSYDRVRHSYRDNVIAFARLAQSR